MSGTNKKTKKIAKNKKTTKKKRVNKTKVIILICFLGIFVLGAGNLALGVNQVMKNKENKEIIKEEEKIKEKQFELEIENEDKIGKKYTILVDPGHGGYEKGTQNKSRTIYEKDIALAIGKKVAMKLSKQSDVQVIISRTEDKYVSLADRSQMANTQNVDALVSIHVNAEGGGESAYGLETYYRKGATDGSDKLAKIVQDTIGSYVAIRDRGIREDIYQVLKESRMPAVLVECGFITNKKESEKLLDEIYQSKLADGIAQGVLSFLDEQSK
ncbi:MAG: N-acetylmuramoyl-L-alanine amidase [Romboutsia sp.]